jgi:hypothetical protein
MLVLASIANLFPQPSLVGPGKAAFEKDRFSFAFASAVAKSLRRMISWRGVAKKRRAQALAETRVKCSPSVAARQQSWLDGNHLVFRDCHDGAAPQGPTKKSQNNPMQSGVHRARSTLAALHTGQQKKKART